MIDKTLEQIKSRVAPLVKFVPYIIVGVVLVIAFIAVRTVNKTAQQEIRTLRETVSVSSSVIEDKEKLIEVKEKDIVKLSKQLIKLNEEITKLQKKIYETPHPNSISVPDDIREVKRSNLEDARELNKLYKN